MLKMGLKVQKNNDEQIEEEVIKDAVIEEL